MAPSKMSFAQRMMAKYGHEEGKGLGKNGEGITAPVEAVTTINRMGVGAEGGLIKPHAVETQPTEEWVIPRIKSRFLHVHNLDYNSGAATVRDLFDGFPGLVEIKASNTDAWAEFDSEEHADAALETNGMHFGWSGAKVTVCLIEEKDVPKVNEETNGPFLSRFIREEKENARLTSSTMRLSFLLESSETRYLNAMCENSGTVIIGDSGDPYDDDVEEDTMWYKAAHTESPGSGTLLVRMESPKHAKQFVAEWNGRYFKTRTVYVKLVADAELDKILDKKKAKEGSKGALFLRPLPKEMATEEAVAKLFPGVEIYNVNFPPNSNSAIVFLDGATATRLVAENPHGFRVQGRRFFVQPFLDKKQKKRQAHNASSTDPSPVAAITNQTANMSISAGKNGPRNKKTFDVIVKGLHFNATESDVKDFFGGFSVVRVSFPKSKGIVFVALESPGEQ